MNIILPFRNTCGNEELKMCIKLIKKNLKISYNTIYIIGDNCGFKENKVKNIIIEEQKYNKWLDSNFLVKYCIENITKDEPFILFNDDFFLTDDVEEIPNYYYDTLQHRSLTTKIINESTKELKSSAYGLNILKFIELFGDFRNYEVHIPMIINFPDIMSVAIDKTKECDCPALKRTMYQKMLDELLETKETHISIENDIKFGEPYKIIQYPFFSLTDREFEVFKKTFEDLLK